MRKLCVCTLGHATCQLLQLVLAFPLFYRAMLQGREFPAWLRYAGWSFQDRCRIWTFRCEQVFQWKQTSAVPGGGLTEFLCMWAKELCTWQKVTWSECSSLEKLGPLQKQLTSLGGNSQWRGDKVCNCSRDWAATVRVMQTTVYICSVPPNQASPGFLPCFSSLEPLFP